MEGVFAVQAIMNLVDNLTGPLRRIDAQLGAAQHSADSLSGNMGRLAAAMVPVATVSAAVVGALVGLASTTIDTQARMGELASVGVEDFAAMDAAATDFSNRFAGTTKAAFVGAAYDIKSGISSLSDEGVAKYTELAALTGKATKATTEEMTSLFATGYGIYREFYSSLSDMEFGERFSAGLASSVKMFKTTGPAMQGGIENLGAVATKAGMAMEEQLAVLGMLQATMSGAEAGTAYKAVFEQAAGASKDLGVSFLDVNNKLVDMPTLLDRLHGKFGDTLDFTEQSQILAAFGQEGSRAIMQLWDQTGKLRDNIGAVGDAMGAGTGYTLEMAQAMNRDLGASLSIGWQRVKNLGEILGSMFAPTMQSVVDIGSDFVLVLQRGAKWLGSSGIGQGIMNVLGALSAGILTVAGFAGAFWALGAIKSVVLSALAPIGSAIAAIGWPIWLVGAAVAGLYLAWKKNFGGIRDTVSRWWNTISLVFRGVWAVFSSLKGTVGSIDGPLAKKIKAAGLEGLITTVSKVVNRIKAFFGGMVDGIKLGFAPVAKILSPIIGSIANAFDSVKGPIGDFIGSLTGAGAATKVASWREFGAVVGLVLGDAFKVVAAAIRLALMPLTYIIDLFSGWMQNIKQGKGVWEGLWMALKTAGLKFISDIKSLLLSFDIVEDISKAFGSVLDYLSNINLFDVGAKMIGTLVGGIKSLAKAPYDAVMSIFQHTDNLFAHSDAKEGPLSRLSQSGRAIMTTLASGVLGAAPDLVFATRRTLSGVSDAAGLSISPSIEPPGIPEVPHLPNIGAKAIWESIAPVAPAVPDLVPSISWRGLPAVSASDLMASEPALTHDFKGPSIDLGKISSPVSPKSDAGRRVIGQRQELQQKNITIRGLVVHLHGVENAQDFLGQLKRYVEQHDA